MTRPGNIRTGPDAVRIADECAKVADLRALGLSFRAIAQALGLELTTAHRRWTEALSMRVVPNIEEAIKASLARLDLLDERLIDGLRSADLPVRLKAVDSARKIDESRRVLLGANQPQRITVTDSGESSEIDAAIIELSRRHAAKY